MSDNILVEIINNAQALSAGIKPALYFGDNAYVHIRFAPNGTPTDAQMTITPGDFIGLCSNHDKEAPTTASSYIWARINSSAVQAAVEAAMRAADASATQSSASAAAADVAKHDAQSAKVAAESARDTATTKATEASASATAANTAKMAAETAKTAAESARTTATTKANEAAISATAAATAKMDAQAAKSASESARDTATTKATEAAASATTANTAKTAAEAAKVAAESARTTAMAKATEASASATTADTAKTAAESAKTTAVAKAGEAAASAIEAAGYAEAAGSAHPPVTIQPDTTTTAQPAAGGTVTMVDSVTRNSLGHVEKINTKTVTLPTAIDISGKLDKAGDGSNVTAAFTQATSRANIISGEKLSVLFGKVMKFFVDLKSVAFSGSYTDLTNKPTTMTASGGSADTATKLATARLINGKSFDGSANVESSNLYPTAIPASVDLNSYTQSGLYYCAANATAATMTNRASGNAFFLIVGRHAGTFQLWIEYLASGAKIFYRNYYQSWGVWQRLYTTSDPPASVSGNAGTATKLATPRTINGVAFDGTTSITVEDGTKVPTTRTVNGKVLSANISLAAADVGARPSTWMPTAANIGAAVTSLYTASIPSTGWIGSAAPFSISVTVTGILATDTPLIDIVQTGTESTDEIMRENWNKITRITTAANSITVFASEIPSAAIPIQLKVVR